MLHMPIYQINLIFNLIEILPFCYILLYNFEDHNKKTLQNKIDTNMNVNVNKNDQGIELKTNLIEK